jgi:hypothetical protein
MEAPRTKLDVLYQESLGDISGILTRIENINTGSENITKLIEKFNSIESRADKKIDDINSATKLFNKNIYIALACIFLFTSVIGAVSGYIFFKEELQTKVFENELKKISDSRLKFEEENQSKILAEKNGVIFYSDGISIPTKTPDIEAAEGHAIYRYQKNNPSPSTKK